MEKCLQIFAWLNFHFGLVWSRSKSVTFTHILILLCQSAISIVAQSEKQKATQQSRYVNFAWRPTLSHRADYKKQTCSQSCDWFLVLDLALPVRYTPLRVLPVHCPVYKSGPNVWKYICTQIAAAVHEHAWVHLQIFSKYRAARPVALSALHPAYLATYSATVVAHCQGCYRAPTKLQLRQCISYVLDKHCGILPPIVIQQISHCYCALIWAITVRTRRSVSQVLIDRLPCLSNAGSSRASQIIFFF